MKTSNKFTLTRVICAPIFFLIYFLPIWTGKFCRESAFIMIPFLAVVEFTDYLDGHFARKHNEVSDFGKLFDPFADIILHLTTFVCLMFSVGKTATLGSVAYIQPIIFILIVYREFTMNFCRMIAAKKGTAIAARKGGKFKTVLYVFSGFFALLLESFLRLGIEIEILPQLHTACTVLFVLCVVASYVSFADYLVHFKNLLAGEM